MFGSGAIVLSVVKLKGDVFFSKEYIVHEGQLFRSEGNNVDLDCVMLPVLIDTIPEYHRVMWLNCKLSKPYFFSSLFKDERKYHFRLNFI